MCTRVRLAFSVFLVVILCGVLSTVHAVTQKAAGGPARLVSSLFGKAGKAGDAGDGGDDSSVEKDAANSGREELRRRAAEAAARTVEQKKLPTIPGLKVSGAAGGDKHGPASRDASANAPLAGKSNGPAAVPRAAKPAARKAPAAGAGGGAAAPQAEAPAAPAPLPATLTTFRAAVAEDDRKHSEEVGAEEEEEEEEKEASTGSSNVFVGEAAAAQQQWALLEHLASLIATGDLAEAHLHLPKAPNGTQSCPFGSPAGGEDPASAQALPCLPS